MVCLALLLLSVSPTGSALGVRAFHASPASPQAKGAVPAPAGAAYSLWGTATGSTETGKGRVYGTRFKVSRNGQAVAIRFLSPAGDRGKHKGVLYNGRGHLLAKAAFKGGRAGGWRSAQLSRPVTLHRGRTYVVAFTTRSGLHAVGGGLPFRTGSVKAVAGLVGRKGLPKKETSSAQLVDVVYHPLVGPFPDAGNTGAPESGLSTYTGPCTITADGTVIDHKVVECDLEIHAANVKISNSVVNATIDSGSEPGTGYSFTLVDSTLDVSPNGVILETGVGEVNFKVIRSEIRGGNRGINCTYHCLVRSSWVHGQDTDASGVFHESGIRMSQRTKLINNSIACDAPNVPPDAGCSAPLTGYGDFAPVRDNVIDGNLFLASTGGTCAYGGSSGGKPYSDDAANIRFMNNVFQRGEEGTCGDSAPIMDFESSAPGNEWVGNTWVDGGTVTP